MDRLESLKGLPGQTVIVIQEFTFATGLVKSNDKTYPQFRVSALKSALTVMSHFRQRDTPHLKCGGVFNSS